MIVEKPLPVPEVETTHVFYASMPEPEVDVDGLARQFNNSTLDMGAGDQPPAYDALSIVNAPHTTPTAGSKGDPPQELDPDRPDERRSPPDHQTPFERPIPPQLQNLRRGGGSRSSIQTFGPLVLHSKTKKLEDGFFTVLPPTDVSPHPFGLRDVQEMDWKQ